MLRKLLVLEKLLGNIDFKRFEKAFVYMKNNLFDSGNNMYLAVDSLIDIDNIVTGSNNITQINDNVKPQECDKIYMDKDLLQDKLYQLIDQFNETKNKNKDFYFPLLGSIQTFYDGGTYKVLFYLQLWS